MEEEKRPYYLDRIRLEWDRCPEVADSYVGGIPCIRALDSLDIKSNVLFFTGENGSGKSTLLESLAMCYGLNPEGGPDNFSSSQEDDVSGLRNIIVTSKVGYPRHKLFVRAESFRSIGILHDRDEWLAPYPKWVDGMSHGQGLMKLLLKYDTHASTLVFLDEPEAALSAKSQMALLSYIMEASGYATQFVVSTHSPIILSVPGAQIMRFDEDVIREVGYEETDAYFYTSMMINNRERMIKELSCK